MTPVHVFVTLFVLLLVQAVGIEAQPSPAAKDGCFTTEPVEAVSHLLFTNMCKIVLYLALEDIQIEHRALGIHVSHQLAAYNRQGWLSNRRIVCSLADGRGTVLRMAARECAFHSYPRL